MKICTTNDNGQMVIPKDIRKKFKITKKTPLKVFTKKNHICIEPLEIEEEKTGWEDTIIHFPKKYSKNEFPVIKGGEDESYADKIDEILYS